MNPTTDPAEIRTRILDTHARYADRPQGWVGLAEIRAGVQAPRDLVDRELVRLAEDGVATFTPEMNQRLLTAMDRAAALRLGGEAKHLMSRCD